MNDYDDFFAQVSPGWSPFTATDAEIETFIACGKPTQEQMLGALIVEVRVYEPEGD